MIKNFIKYLILSLSSSIYADNRLEGKWKSSLELTKEYNDRYAKLEKNQVEFINQVAGTLEVTYLKSEYLMNDTSRQIEINNKKFQWHADKSRYPYKIISSDDSKVVIKAKGLDGAWKVNTIHFESNDVYWVYWGEDFAVHAREYFVRIH